MMPEHDRWSHEPTLQPAAGSLFNNVCSPERQQDVHPNRVLLSQRRWIKGQQHVEEQPGNRPECKPGQPGDQAARVPGNDIYAQPYGGHQETEIDQNRRRYEHFFTYR